MLEFLNTIGIDTSLAGLKALICVSIMITMGIWGMKIYDEL